MKLEKCMPSKCLICGEFYTYGWGHILTKKPNYPFLIPRDQAHQDALDKFRSQGYRGDCPFCGGKVSTYGNPDNYETTCNSCHFLYDED